ncbi:MAG: hypothetical protein ACTSXQ_05155 [Alphaproteobacteria bacterium]
MVAENKNKENFAIAAFICLGLFFAVASDDVVYRVLNSFADLIGFGIAFIVIAWILSIIVGYYNQ